MKRAIKNRMNPFKVRGRFVVGENSYADCLLMAVVELAFIRQEERRISDRKMRLQYFINTVSKSADFLKLDGAE